MAATRYYVDIENLKTFWSKAKVFIQALSVNGITFGTDNAITLGGGDITVGGSGDYKSSTLQAAINAIDGRLDTLSNKDTELSTLISNLRTDLTAETTNRTNADTTHTQAISEIKNYTVNAKKISTSPVLNADEIPYSSDNDTTSTYDKINSLDQSLSGVKSSYVESVTTTDGTYVKLTPNSATTGAVNVAVDDASITTELTGIKKYTVNAKKISTSPVLTGNDITLGVSVGDNTNYPTTKTVSASIQKLRETIAGLGQVMELKGVVESLPSTTSGYGNGDVIIVGNKEYVCYNSAWYLLGDTTQLSQDVSTIKSSYVKSVTTTDGTYVKLTPDSATTGAVNVAVDDASITTALAGKSDTSHNHSGVYVPVGRKVNGKALSADITLSPADIGAVPTTRTVNSKALSSNITLGYGDVGAAAASHSHTMSHISDYGTYVYDATITRTKNTVLAAPNGSNGVASFRALVAADIPTHTHTKAQITDYTDTKNTAGSTNSTSKLYLIGATSQAANPQTYSNASVYTSGGMIYATDFVTTSDRRLKKNIVEVDEEMMKKSLLLKTYEFDFTNTGEHSIGYIAQEVQEILPSMVKENECSDGEKFLAMKYTNIHSLQIKALISKVNILEEENTELKERLEKLEKIVEKFV